MTDDHVADFGAATLQRIDLLLGELDALSTAYKQRLQASTRLERRELPDPIPGLHDFVVSIKGTRNSVQRVLKARAAASRDVHGHHDDDFAREERDSKDKAVIMGCGLSTHQAQWDAIKRTHGLLAFRRRFSGKGGKLGPTIDAVVQNGTEWIKVSIVTEKKLLYQMAQEGWHPEDSDDDEDSDDSDDEDSGIAIIKTTKQLVRAARLNRCNTRTPQIRLVLPNIAARRLDAIDKILNRTRRLGRSNKGEADVHITIDCADSAFLQQPIPPLDQAFAHMFRDTNQDRLTSTLNLELTIILSLVSDIAHSEIEPQPWFSRQTLSILEDESHAPGVRLKSVYEALRGRRLECTQEVAREVRNVVNDLATETTKTRTCIFFGRESMLEGFDAPRKPPTACANGHGQSDIIHDDSGREAQRVSLVSGLQKLSQYPVPEDLQLPIQVVGEDEFNHREYATLIEAGKLPPVAEQVWVKLDRSYNRSCHLWGWLQDITTISANNLNARLIDATVDKVRSYIICSYWQDLEVLWRLRPLFKEMSNELTNCRNAPVALSLDQDCTLPHLLSASTLRSLVLRTSGSRLRMRSTSGKKPGQRKRNR